MAGLRRCISPKRVGGVLVGMLLLVAFTSAAFAACTGEDAGASVVTEIHEGETLILGDGRTVRLANLYMPKRARNGQVSEARAETEKALAALVLNKRVELKVGDTKRDRYGRLLAHVMVAGERGSDWVQDRLVATGLARVMVAGEANSCLDELIARENEAREAGRGLWKIGYFAIRPASAEDLLAGLVQSYEIVEGEVTTVATVRGRTYLNFGTDWRRDFTAMIPEQSLQQLAVRSPGFDASKLKGQVVRVRGWLESFNGPSIAVRHAVQLEVIKAASPSQ